MSNIEITNRQTTGVVVLGTVFEDEILTASGAEVWPEGSVLGRVTSGGKLVRFDPGAADGSEVPLAVLTVEVEFTGAGDRTERPAISGQVKRGRIFDINDAALTQPFIDQLRGFTIVALNTHQLTSQDNQ